MMRLTFPACLAGALALLLAVGLGAGAEARELHRAHADAHAQAAAHAHARAHVAIIGGAAAANAAFPWLAEIIDARGSEAGQCTGTVVAPRLILTAGHCVENMRTGTLREASGFTVLTFAGATATGEPNVSTVSGVIAYEGFKRGVDDGDAALLALSAPVGAPAVVLAAGVGQPTAGTAATIVGWGRTSFTQRRPSEALHSAGTAVQASAWCKRHAPPFFARGELCALDPPSDTTGACNGDSGGPLLTAGVSGEPVEVGIAVHVYRRCSTRRPTVFTSVSSLAPWLDSWIAAYAVP
jgi:secreted trypsin-like serine protease